MVTVHILSGYVRETFKGKTVTEKTKLGLKAKCLQLTG